MASADRRRNRTSTATASVPSPAEGEVPVQPPQAAANGLRADAGRHQPGRPPPWQAAYLAALERTGQQVAAAKAAKVDYSTVFRHRKSDSVFEQAERDTMNIVRELAESEAVRRAVEGVEAIYITKDGRTHKERRFSDTILLRLLEKTETGSWRQKQQVEHSGGMTFKTRAERKAALEQALAAREQRPVPVTAVHGRS